MTTSDLVKKSMNIHGGTQAEFAKACGISQGLVSQFLSGAKQPGWRTCQCIERVTKGRVTRYQLRSDIFGEERNIMKHKHDSI